MPLSPCAVIFAKTYIPSLPSRPKSPQIHSEVFSAQHSLKRDKRKRSDTSVNMFNDTYGLMKKDVLKRTIFIQCTDLIKFHS